MKLTKEDVERFFEERGFPRYAHCEIRDLALAALDAQPVALHSARPSTAHPPEGWRCMCGHLNKPEAEECAHAALDTPREILASRLIDAWVADKGAQIPWAKAVQITAIVCKQPDAERDRLLRMGDEDGSCGMCGRGDAPPASLARDALERKFFEYADRFSTYPGDSADETRQRMRGDFHGIFLATSGEDQGPPAHDEGTLEGLRDIAAGGHTAASAPESQERKPDHKFDDNGICKRCGIDGYGHDMISIYCTEPERRKVERRTNTEYAEAWMETYGEDSRIFDRRQSAAKPAEAKPSRTIAGTLWTDERFDAKPSRAEELLRELWDFVKHAQVESGVCCCGTDMLKGDHTGHSARDMWNYALEGWQERIDAHLKERT